VNRYDASKATFSHTQRNCNVLQCVAVRCNVLQCVSEVQMCEQILRVTRDSLSRSLSIFFSLSLSHTHTQTHTLSHTHSLSLSLSLSHTHSLSPTLSFTRTYTHTLSYFLFHILTYRVRQAVSVSTPLTRRWGHCGSNSVYRMVLHALHCRWAMVRVAVCCSVLKYVAVCCSVLQCARWCCTAVGLLCVV